ncbi:hypothetical protein VNO80_25449 [Phaseolus coccineus]|uniref:Uncharacterized protein n=1 Tax=Phaseolus coccineus TaxID=3886 RepID=A0AAN9LUU6_PHACN
MVLFGGNFSLCLHHIEVGFEKLDNELCVCCSSFVVSFICCGCPQALNCDNSATVAGPKRPHLQLQSFRFLLPTHKAI